MNTGGITGEGHGGIEGWGGRGGHTIINGDGGTTF